MILVLVLAVRIPWTGWMDGWMDTYPTLMLSTLLLRAAVQRAFIHCPHQLELCRLPRGHIPVSPKHPAARLPACDREHSLRGDHAVIHARSSCMMAGVPLGSRLPQDAPSYQPTVVFIALLELSSWHQALLPSRIHLCVVSSRSRTEI